MHIVIASGNPLLRETLRSYFQYHGHSARVTESGVECMTAVRESRPDSVVLEDQLLWGGSDGVVEAIHADPAMQGIKTIIVKNSKPTPEPKTGCSGAGANRATLQLPSLLHQIEA